MINDAALADVRNPASPVTAAEKAIGEGEQTAATAVEAAADQAAKILEDPGETLRRARSAAGGVAQGVLNAGCRATRSVSRQIAGKPVIAVLVGFALGYVAGFWVRTGRGASSIGDDKPNPGASSS
jgi:ElaB/YqjD/DUF883 family membrane-anchored ribosome-binding protein